MSDIQYSRWGETVPQSFTARPLSGGMRTNAPTTLLKSNECLNLQGFFVHSDGYKIRDAFTPFIGNATYGRIPLAYSDEIVLETFVFWDYNNKKSIVVMTNRRMYKSSDLQVQGFSPVFWKRDYKNWTLVGDTLTLTGTPGYTWADNVSTGDRIRASSSLPMYVRLIVDATDVEEWFKIIAVTDTTIQLESAPASGPYKTTMHVLQELHPVAPEIPQWTRAPGCVFLVDGSSNGILKIAPDSTGASADNIYMSEHFVRNQVSASTRAFVGAKTIFYKSGFLLVGSVSGDAVDGAGRARLKWSLATDLAEFDDTNYIQFVETPGDIIKILALDEYPVVVLEDSIYAGINYSPDVPTQPWIFSRCVLNGTSAVGSRAITAIVGGILYVGRDDIYVMSSLKRTDKGNFIVEPQRCPIFRSHFRTAAYIENTRVIYDSVHMAFIFAVSKAQAVGYDSMIFHNLETNAWSHVGDGVLGTFTSVQDIAASAGVTWQEMITEGTQWADLLSYLWQSLNAQFSLTTLLITDTNGILYSAAPSTGHDTFVSYNGSTYTPVDYPLMCELETGDFDFNDADHQKTVLKFALRIGSLDVRIGATTMILLGSTDRGHSWKYLGALNYASNVWEDEVRFKLTGNIMRFKLTFNTSDRPFKLEEITYKVRIRGDQASRRAQ